MKKQRLDVLKKSMIMLTAAAMTFTSVPMSWQTAQAATVKNIKVNKKGFDKKGRMVAKYGSPTIDGKVDKMWKEVPGVHPILTSGKTKTTATFKTMWDDNGIYYLVEVKDKNLSLKPASVYNKDSVEFFLDEKNNKTKNYEADDLQFRVNYKNQQSSDHGDLNRLYSKAKTVKGGYVIEGRVALTSKPKNNKIFGVELQVNDAKGEERIATLGVFDKTGKAFEDTSKFGEVILTGRPKNAKAARNPYDLISLIKQANEIELERYENGLTVSKLINKADKAVANKKTTQKSLNKVYKELETAIENLVHNDKSFDEKECRQIPKAYKDVSKQPGRVERIDYKTNTYDENKKDLMKHVNVYVPYGYDAKDTNKKYDILYLIHGMGENAETPFGGPGEKSELRNVIDNMIAAGKLKPMIIVSPDWYNDDTVNANMFGLVENFHNELVKDIIPTVESRYNVYAKTTGTNDLIAARNHRAFGGFSMGSGCTWYNYINCVDYFKYYMPISLWCLKDVSNEGYTGSKDDQMAQYLADVAIKKGYTKDDIRIFCATGTEDMAYGGMVSQIEAMKKLPNIFKYSADLRKGNFYFLKLTGGTHIWNCVNRYLYNMLPDLFFDNQEAAPTTTDGIVAQFGSPVVDGKVDDVWKNAQAVTPAFNTSKEGTTATFKTMWDDNGLYVLADVKDKNCSIASNTPYQQDSMEIFLDENNDKTKEFGPDDVQFRINYNNDKTADKGDKARLYSKTLKTSAGYVIEARIEFNKKPANDMKMGIELQINDAKGTERVGTLNVFDNSGTAYCDTTKFGTITLQGKTKDSVTGVNPYKLFSLIDSAKNVNLSEYKNASVLTDAIKKAEAVANKATSTQKEIDEQYTAIQKAQKDLVYTEEAANVKRFKVVPTSYKAENAKAGKIVSLTYDAPNATGGKDKKTMNVYLPYGYNDADKATKYNVLYLMHGGGENENTIFGGAGQSKEMKRILDNIIANGDIKPMIVVTPTSNNGENDVAKFHKELMDIVVPMVETTYHTYATKADKADLKATREHRAFGGFSMGSVCTWYVFENCLDYFKYYLPLSGDCWNLGQGAGASKSKETAALLAKVVKDAGYGPKDFYIFSATGSQDIAYPNLAPQMDEMKKLTDTFKFSADTTKGNTYFIVADGGTHDWNFINQYIYDIVPDLFK